MKRMHFSFCLQNKDKVDIKRKTPKVWALEVDLEGDGLEYVSFSLLACTCS